MQVTISGVAHIIAEVHFEKTIDVSKEDIMEANPPLVDPDDEESQANWKDCIEEYVSDYGIYEMASNEIESGMALELTDDTDGYSLNLEGFTLERVEEFNVEH